MTTEGIGEVDGRLDRVVQELREVLCKHGALLEQQKVGSVNSIEGSITLLRMARRDLRRR